MNFTYLLLFTVLISSINLNLAAKDNVVDKNGQLTPNYVNTKPQELLRIFTTSFELKELLWAVTNPKIAAIAKEAFNEKYNNCEIKICDGTNTIYESEFDETTYIEITSYKSAVGTLQHFGPFIKRLTIVDEFDKSVLANINEPMKQMEFLKIDIKESSAKTLSFDKLFPNLKELIVNIKSDVAVGFLDCELASLETLAIHVADGDWKKVEGLIKKSPTIKNIEINGFPSDYIIQLHTLLPNLESLRLYDQKVDTAKQTLCFEKIKTLEISGSEKVPTSSPGSIELLSFPSLERLQFSYSDDFADKWTTFFKNHPQIKDLELAYCPFYLLAEFTAKLTNLKFFDLEFEEMGTVEDFQSFFDGHKKLQAAYFSTETNLKPSDEDICKAFKDQWHRAYPRIRYQSLSIKRTTLTFHQDFDA